MPKVDTATLSQRARDRLREEILSNRLPPGTRLREHLIAASLHISRAPVREALRLLAAEDLVTIRPRHGAVVKAMSVEDFLAAYQLREALEVLGVRLAVPRLVEEDIHQLERLQARMRLNARRGEVDAYFETNAAFHSLLIERSANRPLQREYSQLINHLRRYRLRSLRIRGDIERSQIEHDAIIGAIRRRDIDAAARLLSEHIQVPQRILQAAPEGELVPVPAPRRSRRTVGVR